MKFPHVRSHQVDDEVFVAAWAEWLERYAPEGWPHRGIIPQGHQKLSLRELVATRGPFSLDVLCRILVPPQYRNTMQATKPFLSVNSHLVNRAIEKVTNPKGPRDDGRRVYGVELTKLGRHLAINAGRIMETRTIVRSLVEADIEAFNGDSASGKVSEKRRCRPLVPSSPYQSLRS